MRFPDSTLPRAQRPTRIRLDMTARKTGEVYLTPVIREVFYRTAARAQVLSLHPFCESNTNMLFPIEVQLPVNFKYNHKTDPIHLNIYIEGNTYLLRISLSPPGLKQNKHTVWYTPCSNWLRSLDYYVADEFLESNFHWNHWKRFRWVISPLEGQGSPLPIDRYLYYPAKDWSANRAMVAFLSNPNEYDHTKVLQSLKRTEEYEPEPSWLYKIIEGNDPLTLPVRVDRKLMSEIRGLFYRTESSLSAQEKAIYGLRGLKKSKGITRVFHPSIQTLYYKVCAGELSVKDFYAGSTYDPRAVTPKGHPLCPIEALHLYMPLWEVTRHYQNYGRKNHEYILPLDEMTYCLIEAHKRLKLPVYRDYIRSRDIPRGMLWDIGSHTHSTYPLVYQRVLVELLFSPRFDPLRVLELMRYGSLEDISCCLSST